MHLSPKLAAVDRRTAMTAIEVSGTNAVTEIVTGMVAETVTEIGNGGNVAEIGIETATENGLDGNEMARSPLKTTQRVLKAKVVALMVV